MVDEAFFYSPIRILPPELLAEIFEHCASAEMFSPVRISHVSTHWRRTAITTPCLWHSVCAKIPTATPRITSAKVCAWLARSGSIPLHISLNVSEWSDGDISFPLFHHLRNHSHHWGRLSLITSSHTIARRIFQFTSFSHHDMLSRLDLSIGSPSLDPDPDESEDERGCITVVVTGLMGTDAPRLTEFNLATSVLPYEWTLKTHVGFLHLCTLRIFEQNDFGDISPSTMLQLLAKCPTLERFIFMGSYGVDPRGVSDTMVNLPRLRELHIAQTVHQRAMLAHLVTPALRVLRLSWLNRREALIDDSYVHDPSEENSEEPTEWSQSPYTDLLTGVGIRSLIGRGAPPIRVLDLDFADARSPKDFVWMFEHLPTLESFRITGSDMSDKVLKALASETDGGIWLCPRLTSLEFSRCDVITGRGVVALAKGRNTCRDCIGGKSTKAVTADRVRPVRLKKFIVEACAGVDCESVAVTQHLLGNVNFEVEVVSTSNIYAEEDMGMSF